MPPAGRVAWRHLFSKIIMVLEFFNAIFGLVRKHLTSLQVRPVGLDDSLWRLWLSFQLAIYAS